MMSNQYQRRLLKLEAARHSGRIILHFTDGHTKTPMVIPAGLTRRRGGLKFVHRILDTIDRPAMASQTTLLYAHLVKGAARIEESGHLFEACRALLLGPVDTPQQLKEEI